MHTGVRATKIAGEMARNDNHLRDGLRSDEYGLHLAEAASYAIKYGAELRGTVERLMQLHDMAINLLDQISDLGKCAVDQSSFLLQREALARTYDELNAVLRAIDATLGSDKCARHSAWDYERPAYNHERI